MKSTNASEREVKDSYELFTLARENELDVVIDLAPYGNTVTLEILKSALSNGIDCVLANKAPLVYSYHLLKKLSDTSGAKFLYVVFARYSYHARFTHRTTTTGTALRYAVDFLLSMSHHVIWLVVMSRVSRGFSIPLQISYFQR